MPSTPATTPTLGPTETPAQTPVSPTETLLSWLSIVTDSNQLNSNWTDSNEFLYSNQNTYNWAFVQASNQYGVPTWVLKAIAAHESSFNPSATNDIRAAGLTGMTGNGISFIIENTDDVEDPFINSKIEDSYDWLMTVYPYTAAEYRIQEGESYIQWYNRLLGIAHPLPADGACLDSKQTILLHSVLEITTRSYYIDRR